MKATKKKRGVRSGRGGAAQANGSKPKNVEPVAAPVVTVNRVTLDNTVPQGFRNVAVPVKPGQSV